MLSGKEATEAESVGVKKGGSVAGSVRKTTTMSWTGRAFLAAGFHPASRVAVGFTSRGRAYSYSPFRFTGLVEVLILHKSWVVLPGQPALVTEQRASQWVHNRIPAHACLPSYCPWPRLCLLPNYLDGARAKFQSAPGINLSPGCMLNAPRASGPGTSPAILGARIWVLVWDLDLQPLPTLWLCLLSVRIQEALPEALLVLPDPVHVIEKSRALVVTCSVVAGLDYGHFFLG